MKKQLTILLTVFCIQACKSIAPAPAALVIPRNDGRFEVRAKGPTNHDAMRSALDGAAGACQGDGRSYVVDNESVLYKGAFDESSINLIDQLNKTAALFSSSTGSRFAPRKPDSTPEDYEAILQVRCK